MTTLTLTLTLTLTFTLTLDHDHDHKHDLKPTAPPRRALATSRRRSLVASTAIATFARCRDVALPSETGA